jgi:subtilisin family serine protease
MRRAILLLTMVGAVLLACSGVLLAQQQGGPDASRSSQSERFAPDRVIVKLKEGAQGGALEALNRGVGARTEGRIAPHTLPTLYTVKLPPQGQSVESAIRHYEASPDVAYAEPDFFVHHDAHQAIADPYYNNGSLWGLNNTGQNSGKADADVDAPEGWEVTADGDAGIVVAVIDEGVDHNHPDLAGNIWTNPNEPKDGIDNDGNGKIDDVHGWDFHNNDSSTYDGSGDDHGTHVAGTIGALGNDQGVVGVSELYHSKVEIITAKFLGPNGGYTSNAVKALDYLTDLKKTRGISNLVLTSNSWGGGGYSQGLYDAINRANAQGILFVAAAGNGGSDGVGDNNDATPHYPSSYNLQNVIAVAATNRNDAKAGFSNYGANSVDLGAPGSAIYSTLPNNTYGSYSGTSMATPHVSGALALLMSRGPVRHLQAKERLLDAERVDKISSLEGKTVTGGRLNLAKALGVVTPPGTPADTTAPTVGDVSPAHGAANVAPDTNVTATFSEDVKSVNDQTFKLVMDGTTTSVGAAVTYADKTATLDPTAALEAGKKYTATVTTGVTDLAGNALAVDRTWSFTTTSPATTSPDTTAPSVTGSSPTGTKTVPVTTSVNATFSEDVKSVNDQTFKLVMDGTTTSVGAAVTYADKTATLKPTAKLISKKTYTATVTIGVTDLADNALLNDYAWSFTTK